VTPKLPATSAKELVRVAEKLGFVFRRQSGAMPSRCARALGKDGHVGDYIPILDDSGKTGLHIVGKTAP
jgi:hypothetical protein